MHTHTHTLTSTTQHTHTHKHNTTHTYTHTRKGGISRLRRVYSNSEGERRKGHDWAADAPHATSRRAAADNGGSGSGSLGVLPPPPPRFLQLQYNVYNESDFQVSGIMIPCVAALLLGCGAAAGAKPSDIHRRQEWPRQSHWRAFKKLNG
jgi:hypothetical protein